MRLPALLLFLCFTSLCPSVAQVPTFNWAKGLHGNSNESVSDVALDGTGNVYAVGFFSGSTDFDPGTGVFNLTASTAGSSAYITKLNSSGGFVWAKAFVGAGQSGAEAITIDDVGNIYVTGYFTGTNDFDPGPGMSTLTNSSNSTWDMFVCKLDANGDFQWACKAGSALSSEKGFDIGVDAAANVFVTGSFAGTVDFDPGPGTVNLTAAGNSNPLYNNTDVFLLKLNSAGSLLWANRFGSDSVDQALALAVTDDGDVVVGGSFNDTADFDPSPGLFLIAPATVGIIDAFAVKFSGAGSLKWAKVVARGSDGEDVYSIAVDSLENVYLVGLFSSDTTDFDPGPGTAKRATNGYNDAFVMKLDSLGAYQWANTFGAGNDDAINDVATDGAGNVYVAGFFRNTVDFDPGLGTTLLSTPTSSADAVVVQFNSAGSYMWAGKMGAGGPDGANSIAVDSAGRAYVAGNFQGTVDFDPTAGTSNLSATSLYDVFIGKLFFCGVIPSQPAAISGIPSPCQGTTQTYSVAPVAGATSYSWTIPAGWSGTSTGNTITVTVGAAGGNLTVAALNTCGASAIQTLATTVASNLSQPGPITIGTPLCAGTLQTIFVAPVAGATSYLWTLPTGWAANGNGTSITVFVGLTSGTVSVTAINNCAISAAQSAVVSPIPLPIVTITQSGGVLDAGAGYTSYQWYFNGSVIPGATSQTYSPVGSGDYSVMVTNSSGCTAQSDRVSSTTSLSMVSEAKEIRVYPNPTTNTLYVESPASLLQSIQLKDGLGRVITGWCASTGQGQRVARLDLQHLPAGVYFLKVGEQTVKVLKD